MNTLSLHCILVDPTRTVFQEYGKNWRQNVKTTLSLEVTPERRTRHCSPKFQSGDRFCEQYLMSPTSNEVERSLFIPSPRFKTVGNLFLFLFGAHEFGISTIADHLIFDLKQFLYHINNHAVISIMLNVLGVVILVSIYDCACVLKKTLIFLGSKSLCSTRYVMDGTHAQSLNK